MILYFLKCFGAFEGSYSVYRRVLDAKIKEALLVERLKRYEVSRLQGPMVKPVEITGEERFYMKKMAQKGSNYVPVGRRGVFGGVILNMHMHWKKHETVKVFCKPCKPGQIQEYANELGRLSGGIPIQIIGDDTIIFYRGKEYVQPEVMSPIDTLSKKKHALDVYEPIEGTLILKKFFPLKYLPISVKGGKTGRLGIEKKGERFYLLVETLVQALEKSKYEQSLETVRHFIAIAEKELELYHRHIALYGDPAQRSGQTLCDWHLAFLSFSYPTFKIAMHLSFVYIIMFVIFFVGDIDQGHMLRDIQPNNEVENEKKYYAYKTNQVDVDYGTGKRLMM
ncbi:putative CRM domain-containing protein, chloroplastic [Artemisia annua]|uniref:Putative CRM domain-containing protein, chloroplastic n=1 Tax=Artemisia annua TaxID=35608 RepID=A0A2U1L9I8_ARTAN|nr:putative CRM domain-containing protein, chloroplastic [Artemisia annua]